MGQDIVDDCNFNLEGVVCNTTLGKRIFLGFYKCGNYAGSVYLSVSACLSVYPFFFLSVYPSVNQSVVCPSICLSIYQLSVCPLFCLSAVCSFLSKSLWRFKLAGCQSIPFLVYLCQVVFH